LPDCPTNIVVEYLNGTVWTKAENQVTTTGVCVPNDVMKIEFTPVTIQKVRVVFERNEANNTFVGLTELEIWAPWPQSVDGIYEAEDGLLRDANIHESNTASGGSFVGQIDGSEASIEFTGVWVDQDKTYSVQIYYTNAENNVARMNLTTNSIHVQDVAFPGTATVWGEFDPNNFVTVQVPLRRGNNVFILKHGVNFAELDKINVLL